MLKFLLRGRGDFQFRRRGCYGRERDGLQEDMRVRLVRSRNVFARGIEDDGLLLYVESFRGCRGWDDDIVDELGGMSIAILNSRVYVSEAEGSTLEPRRDRF